MPYTDQDRQRAWIRHRQTRRRDGARAAGRCISCTRRTPPPGHRVCDICNRACKRRTSTLRTRRRADRLCILCGVPVTRFTRCLTHRAQDAAQKRAKRQRDKALIAC